SVLVAHPSLPAKTLAEALELSRTTPVPVGSASSGSNSHLYIEILNSDYGANFVHVPYKGAADAVRDLLGGFTMMQFDSPSSSLPHIEAGKLKPLAVTGNDRMPFLPDVPTGPEQGFPNLNIGTWMAVFGPPGMPADVVARVNQEIVSALQAKEVKDQLEPLGLTVAPTTAEELSELVRHDYDMCGRIINQLVLRLD